jgi:hypothetical protein
VHLQKKESPSAAIVSLFACSHVCYFIHLCNYTVLLPLPPLANAHIYSPRTTPTQKDSAAPTSAHIMEHRSVETTSLGIGVISMCMDLVKKEVVLSRQVVLTHLATAKDAIRHDMAGVRAAGVTAAPRPTDAETGAASVALKEEMEALKRKCAKLEQVLKGYLHKDQESTAKLSSMLAAEEALKKKVAALKGKEAECEELRSSFQSTLAGIEQTLLRKDEEIKALKRDTSPTSVVAVTQQWEALTKEVEDLRRSKRALELSTSRLEARWVTENRIREERERSLCEKEAEIATLQGKKRVVTAGLAEEEEEEGSKKAKTVSVKPAKRASRSIATANPESIV